MIGGAILPSLFKQDPRYFYKGTGSIASRAMYAIANSVICKGDNGHWQANYSGNSGGIAAGGISDLLYPASNRSGVQVTFTNALIGTAGGAMQNLAQEFIVRRLTPKIAQVSVDGYASNRSSSPQIDSTSRFIFSSCNSIDSTSLNCARQRSRLWPSRWI